MSMGELIRFFLTAPGPGGVVIITVIGTACIFYVAITRWILAGGKEDDPSSTGSPEEHT